jgi:hypothetical protein
MGMLCLIKQDTSSCPWRDVNLRTIPENNKNGLLLGAAIMQRIESKGNGTIELPYHTGSTVLSDQTITHSFLCGGGDGSLVDTELHYSDDNNMNISFVVFTF